MAIPYSRYLVGNLPWYSVLMVSAIFIAYLLGTREEKRLELPKDSMLDMVLVAIPSGIIGARLYYVVMSWEQFAEHPLSALYVWEGGIAMYGSLIGGALGVYLYCRIRKRDFASLMDISAPGLALAQAIGRWGNYFNREAYGPVITDPKWQFFPFGVLIEQGGTQVWHVATFFYESMWNLCVFGVLWLIVRKRAKRRGDVFLWYVLLYGCGRFLVEQLRMDSLYLFGFRASQYLSLLLSVVVAIVFLRRISKQARGLAMMTPISLCVLAFIRPLASVHPIAVVLALLLYAFCFSFLLKDANAPLWARIWLIADAVVYILLLALGLNHWWASPYFIYAGLSIPPYIAIVYHQSGLPQPASPQRN